LQLEQVLKEKFDLPSFRLGQKEIIESVAGGNDVLAVMPTGGGKSLCYQLPSQLTPGITIVISPLIALMNDQVSALRAKGLAAGCIHSSMGVADKRAIFSEMNREKNYLLYLSPERIQKPGFANWLKQQEINLFAIDEAHCVSQWGHDFRKEYSQISILRQLKPDVPIIGLTATATPIVKRDIIEQLGLKNADQHVYGFYRPNLYYQVEFCEDDNRKTDYVLEALKKTPEGRIIIYCGTRKKTEFWNELLTERGESVAFYHAGLSNKERTKIEQDYQQGNVRILTATNAFGMGIDHHDVRLVIHTQMPGNIESYYQEIGRAGRDRKPSTCLLTYSKKDKGLQSFFINQSEADRRVKTQKWSALNAMVQYAEGSECRHADILTYFKDQKRITRCGHCDSCAPDSDRRIRAAALPHQIKKAKKKKKEALFEATLSEDQQWRSEVIRDWRKKYAKEHDIPAFMVFSDKTLRDLVLRSPSCEEELSRVYGFGEKKIDVFGKDIIQLLHPS
jgi:ATP-dependent DNA helicase RecQ